MTFKTKWGFLQLFAGEGAGASGAGGSSGDSGTGAPASGGASADAAQNLRAMGVPESKIAKYGKAYEQRAKRSPAAKQATQAPKEEPKQQAAAAGTETAQAEEPKQEAEAKYNWDEVMKDPEMNRRMQETVKASKKKSQAAEDAMAALAPALKTLAQQNGLDPENIDYVALSKHLTGEYDDEALERGLPKETVVKMDQQQREQEKELNRKHFVGLIQQEVKMKQVYPSFDLRKELENPKFAFYTSREVGMSVEDAYRAIHGKELELAQAQAVDRKATQRVMNTIRAGQARPDESGASSQAPSVTQVDWKHATPKQIQEQARRIRLAAAQGRKLRPGE